MALRLGDTALVEPHDEGGGQLVDPWLGHVVAPVVVTAPGLPRARCLVPPAVVPLVLPPPVFDEAEQGKRGRGCLVLGLPMAAVATHESRNV